VFGKTVCVLDIAGTHGRGILSCFDVGGVQCASRERTVVHGVGLASVIMEHVQNFFDLITTHEMKSQM
jgi:hypothetical protein